MSKVNVDEATSDQGNNAALDAKKEAAMSNKKADKANEYVPKVTREDVSRVIRREFPGNKPELILGILDGYGSEEWQPEKARVQLAILKLSHGDVDASESAWVLHGVTSAT